VPDFGPVFGPQGGRIAFTRVSGGGNDVWTMLPSGTDKERLTSADTHEAVSDWGAGP
jgi:Tol biopolymer transport system component